MSVEVRCGLAGRGKLKEARERRRNTNFRNEIWQRKLKKVENLEMSTEGHGIWQEN